MRHILLLICVCIAPLIHAEEVDALSYTQPVSIDDILEDIYNQLAEEGDVPMEDVQEELLDLAANPINLNHTTANELSKLRFLSDEQIDAILLYQYQHPLQDIYELQLIDCLHYYDIRNMLPFVCVGQAEKEKIYFREIFQFGKHEITLRTDARNIEDFTNDPFYAKLRYRFNYKNRIQAGVTMDRASGAPWQDIHYGGYVQVQDIGPMKNIVAGNFQASYGYGMVIGSPFKRGKTAYIQSTATTNEGVKKFGSVSDSYNHLHGIGATAKVSHWADVSAFYSLREEKDSLWHHLIGVNATGRWKRVKVGITAIENIVADSSQAVIGVNARWNLGKVDIWGELATTQGQQWGVGGIAGVRYTPISDLNLLAIYRYYSADYHNSYANALCSKSKINNEHGGYIGIEYNRLNHWQLSAFGDVWKNGFEALAQADFLPQKNYRMHSRFRIKRKDEKDTYSLRWNMGYSFGSWNLKTQVDGNLVQSKDKWSYGWSIFQDVEYRFMSVPIVLQFRAQAFDARKWDNRVYIYENDVLYAYSIPFVYGFGGRFWLNARYKISDIFSLYLRLSETVYQSSWATEHDKKSTRTDIHALLRVVL